MMNERRLIASAGRAGILAAIKQEPEKARTQLGGICP